MTGLRILRHVLFLLLVALLPIRGAWAMTPGCPLSDEGHRSSVVAPAPAGQHVAHHHGSAHASTLGMAHDHAPAHDHAGGQGGCPQCPACCPVAPAVALALPAESSLARSIAFPPAVTPRAGIVPIGFERPPRVG